MRATAAWALALALALGLPLPGFATAPGAYRDAFLVLLRVKADTGLVRKDSAAPEDPGEWKNDLALAFAFAFGAADDFANKHNEPIFVRAGKMSFNCSKVGNVAGKVGEAVHPSAVITLLESSALLDSNPTSRKARSHEF